MIVTLNLTLLLGLAYVYCALYGVYHGIRKERWEFSNLTVSDIAIVVFYAFTAWVLISLS
jgi:hypothetical protein